MVGKDKARVYITFDKNFLKIIRKHAKLNGKTLSKFVSDAIKDWGTK